MTPIPKGWGHRPRPHPDHALSQSFPALRTLRTLRGECATFRIINRT